MNVTLLRLLGVICFLTDCWVPAVKRLQSVDDVLGLLAGTPLGLSRSSDTEFVRKAAEALRRHMADPGFSTTALSGELGYSRMHVNRRFRAILGCSTRGFIRLVRMGSARQLLDGTDMPVSSVARAVGFRTASHFSKVFKCAWGVPPTRLRRMDAAYFK